MAPTGWLQPSSKSFENSPIIQEMLLVLDQLTHQEDLANWSSAQISVGRGSKSSFVCCGCGKNSSHLLPKMVANWANHLIFPLYFWFPHWLSINQRNITRNHLLPITNHESEFPGSLDFPARQRDKGHNCLNNSPTCKGAGAFFHGSQ